LTCEVIDGGPRLRDNPGRHHDRPNLPVRHLVSATLIAVAAIHLLPLVGVLGPAQLQRLYGLPVTDPTLELLLRHRAVLFGLLGAGLAVAALKPAWHGPALIVAALSVVSFLLLAWRVPGSVNVAVATVVRVDWAALALLVVAAVLHWGVLPRRG
jgi:hypothetical protein